MNTDLDNIDYDKNDSEYYVNRDKFDRASPLLEASVNTLTNEFYKPIKIRRNGDQYIAKVAEISGPTYNDDSYIETYVVANNISDLLNQITNKGCALPETIFSKNFEELANQKEWFPEPCELRAKEFKLNFSLSYEAPEESNVYYHPDVNSLLEDAENAGACSAVSGNSVRISIGSIDIYTTNTSHDGFNRAGDLVNYKHSVEPTEFGQKYLNFIDKKKEKTLDI